MKLYDDQLIVVTGGAGFIGSAVIHHLNDRGMSNIVIVDDLGTDEKWKNLVGKSFIEIVPIGQCFQWLKARERDIEAFIHLGACSSTVEKNADFLLENNTNFSIRLAEYALKNNHRFVYASSAATYGDGSLGFSDDHDLIDELQPLNMYGYSKQLFDLWVKSQGVLDRVVGLKYFNVFGPNEYHKGRMASAITHVLPQALQNNVIRLFQSNDPDQFGDGEQKRDFLYVKDAARMTCAFLENDVGGLFNIGSGEASTWNALATAVFKALDKSPNIEYFAMPEDLHGKYQNYTCADMTKSREALGNVAETEALEPSVVEYVKEYLIPVQYY